VIDYPTQCTSALVALLGPVRVSGSHTATWDWRNPITRPSRAGLRHKDQRNCRQFCNLHNCSKPLGDAQNHR
jgi:hypothetical protein